MRIKHYKQTDRPFKKVLIFRYTQTHTSSWYISTSSHSPPPPSSSSPWFWLLSGEWSGKVWQRLTRLAKNFPRRSKAPVGSKMDFLIQILKVFVYFFFNVPYFKSIYLFLFYSSTFWKYQSFSFLLFPFLKGMLYFFLKMFFEEAIPSPTV